jgi:hypothetical protein
VKIRFAGPHDPLLFRSRSKVLTIIVLLLLSLCEVNTRGAQLDILGPIGSEQFGRQVVALSNGNIVVIDPYYDLGGVVDVGAAYLYEGSTGTLISSTTGTTEYDQVGLGGIIVLTNGNYVVASPRWNNGQIYVAGAVTWCSKTIGCPATVTPTNSLVGSSIGDSIGFKNSPGLPNANITPLKNGDYVVGSFLWDNGEIREAGAATFASGDGSTVGPVSATNSLVGTRSSDYVGTGITALTNGNYVVSSPGWQDENLTPIGAVTFCRSINPCYGALSKTISLVGSHPDDGVGSVTALLNGNYVVVSEFWDSDDTRDVGAVSFGDGENGLVGIVSSENSLVGSTFNDRLGTGGVTVLSNGNYVVKSHIWDHGAIVDAGAVTFGDGSKGTLGLLSPANSLVGSAVEDRIGHGSGFGSGKGITALANGSYVVCSPYWDNGGSLSNAGAATFGSGVTGVSGEISVANSLIGASTNAVVCAGEATALASGNYVISSPAALSSRGAVTFGRGDSGTFGVVTESNSLHGSSSGDSVGSAGVIALTNGNYVVNSSQWDAGPVIDAGAATLGDGVNGTVGEVSPANSLVGSSTRDRVGQKSVALATGNYAVISTSWNRGSATEAGAVTIGNGTTGTVGEVSQANSIVGSHAYDSVGIGTGMALGNGNYIFGNWLWQNGAIYRGGAVTYATATTTGEITTANSVLGNFPSGGSSQVFSYDTRNAQVVVGRPMDKIVTFFRPQGKLSGRILTSGGYGVRNAIVRLTDSTGTTRHALTSSFGYYNFENINIGESYGLTISSKQHQFPPREIIPLNSVTELDVIAGADQSFFDLRIAVEN